MADSPITQQRNVQFRGPSTSDDYNQRIAENYQDLVSLYNRMRLNESGILEGYGRFAKDQLSMAQTILNLESRIAALETNQNLITFSSNSQIDNARFTNTPFAITTANQLTQDSIHGYLTLPQVTSSSVSKLAFTDQSTGDATLPSTLGVIVNGVNGTAETATGVVIDTSPPELAIVRTVGRIWERNIVVNSPNVQGSQMYLYIQCPTDLFTNANSNTLILHPFPALGCDILDVAYTVNPSPTMNDSDGYIHFPTMHVGDTNAIGYVPPGIWGNGQDADLNAGFRCYYFDPVPITGLRLKLGQRNYYQENSNYIYSYGASLIDLRYTKFLNTGNAIIRFDAPNNTTISNVTSVQPQMYNVLEAEIPNDFSYQVIWETAYNSGNYTLTPVASSKRVWVEVNLTTTFNGGSPALSGLGLYYS